jgi:hypothetical protein
MVVQSLNKRFLHWSRPVTRTRLKKRRISSRLNASFLASSPPSEYKIFVRKENKCVKFFISRKGNIAWSKKWKKSATVKQKYYGVSRLRKRKKGEELYTRYKNYFHLPSNSCVPWLTVLSTSCYLTVDLLLTHSQVLESDASPMKTGQHVTHSFTEVLCRNIL